MSQSQQGVILIKMSDGKPQMVVDNRTYVTAKLLPLICHCDSVTCNFV